MIAKWYKLYWVHCSELLSHCQKSRITHAVFTKKQVQVGMVGICVPAALTWNDSARIIGRGPLLEVQHTDSGDLGVSTSRVLLMASTEAIAWKSLTRVRLERAWKTECLGVPATCEWRVFFNESVQWEYPMEVSNESVQWQYPMAVSGAGQRAVGVCRVLFGRSVPSTGYSPLPSLCGIQ